MLDNLEIEIKKWDNDYSFSSEEDDKKRVYIIYSPVLKEKLRKVVSPFGVPTEGSIQYEGKNSQGDRILYQQGKDDLPDQLTLISREVEEKPKNIADKELRGKEIEKKEESDEWEKWDAEWERTRELWKEHEKGFEAKPNNSVKHYFSGKNDKGEIVIEGTCIESETESQIAVLEKSKDEKKETLPQHQLPPKK